MQKITPLPPETLYLPSLHAMLNIEITSKFDLFTGCTDIDDALHSRVLENGNWEFGVHIADVSHFLRPNNAMDKEAAHRCTSVYLSGIL